jgi:hypothetical protein
LVLVTLLLVFAFTSSAADDFWVNKNWKSWSKEECAKILSNSPWAKTWISPGNKSQEVFEIQLRSALPIRQALVRLQQFEQKYDKLDDTKRAAFDAQANRILESKYEQLILIHVDYGKTQFTENGDELAMFLRGSLTAFPEGATGLAPRLVTETGDRVQPLSVETKNKLSYEFDLVFPRVKDGAPVIKDGTKTFNIQFLTPTNNFTPTAIPQFIVLVEFDISKMLVDGKPSY